MVLELEHISHIQIPNLNPSLEYNAVGREDHLNYECCPDSGVKFWTYQDVVMLYRISLIQVNYDQDNPRWAHEWGGGGGSPTPW